MVSTVNFLELIGTRGDVSRNFSPESLQALDYVRQTSVHQPPTITEQEVQRFVSRAKSQVRILDSDNVAISSFAKASEHRKNGKTEWFRDTRRWWDDFNERDRVLNLDADLYELSQVITYDSLAAMVRARTEVLQGPLDRVKERRMALVRQKMSYKGKKDVPLEAKEIILNIRHRIDRHLWERHGTAKMSTATSKLGIVFPGSDRIARDIARSSRLTITEAKTEMPALYWQAKVDYYNRYHGHQSAGGQLGDRNHAVYIPYCDYFGTSDDRLVKALESEFKVVLVEDKLHLFRIASENSRT